MRDEDKNTVALTGSGSIPGKSATHVKIIGLIENYSYIVCPDCGKVIRPYGESKIEELAQNYNTQVLATLPIDPELASLCDKGVIELYEGDYFEHAADVIEKI